MDRDDTIAECNVRFERQPSVEFRYSDDATRERSNHALDAAVECCADRRDTRSKRPSMSGEYDGNAKGPRRQATEHSSLRRMRGNDIRSQSGKRSA
jgi:hypothetical protein